ncbi:restriction endonuclease subunit S [Clostridiaceae bacterium OF09-1]|nr:restriction endonuclease subunit S [Clostridiaceae bacterium OF09-1]
MGDVFKEYSEKNHTELPALTIIQGGGTVKREDSDRNLMYDKSNLSNYKMVRKDDFIVHLRSFEGGLEKSSADGIISPAYHAFHSDVADSRFYYPYFRSYEFIKHKLVPHVYGIRDGRSIDIDGMKTIEIPYTSIEEQQKIGDYLESIDHLITLHQWKHYRNKKIINSAWEQRKFSELYVRSSEKNDGSIGMDKNITVATMQFKEDVQVSTAEYLKTYYTFNLGDIAFEGHQSKEFRYGRFVENDIGNGIVSHIFAVFRPIQEYDLYFWKYAINNETLMQRILGRSTKASTMMHDLVANDFLNETFLVPSIDEQKQIGSLFNKLDHLITLHQKKYKILKKLKKFMVKNMFLQVKC